MAIRVGINGFGRIGRITFRAMAAKYGNEIEVVGINDLAPLEASAHLLKYDTNYGVFPGTIEVGTNALVVNGRSIAVCAERDPAQIPWGAVGAQVVIESTGFFTDATKAVAHKRDTVKKVIISAPAKNEDGTFVLGVNEDAYDPAKHHVISNASCTTNCLAPVAKVLTDSFGIEKGFMTTVHAYTNDQRVNDVVHEDMRRARAAAMNIIPTTTGAAKAISLVIPALKDRMHGLAMRVPTSTVSIVDLVALTSKPATEAAVNDALRAAAAGRMKGILDVSDDPLVSSDLRGNAYSSIVDGLSTMVLGGNLVKVLSWYDNEWGYSTRLGDLITFLAGKGL
ncbi:type I glyceraldehyde-3-phosphate dehydrogenase [Candidatus Poribacteria bacterium]|nr:type I glyceraldehyde-3-phosphate dehydrogenase [Candidatus Poribacteria bacterium]